MIILRPFGLVAVRLTRGLWALSVIAAVLNSSRFEPQGETASAELDPLMCFADRTGEVLVKSPGEIAGKDFVLTRLKGCTVYLLDSCGAVRADRLEDCRLVVGPFFSPVQKCESVCLGVGADRFEDCGLLMELFLCGAKIFCVPLSRGASSGPFFVL